MSQADTDNTTTETARRAIEKVSSGLSDLEHDIRNFRNLAYAIRMLATSDEMPQETGQPSILSPIRW
jgi:hypothetical protein